MNNQMIEEIREEKQLIERFDSQIGEQRKINFSRNDDNLDLLAQSDALENHIRVLYDQNKMIEFEINRFIQDDDLIAQQLENNRRSVSPQVRKPNTQSQVPQYEKGMPKESWGPRDSAISTQHGTTYRRTGQDSNSPLRMSHVKSNAGGQNAGQMLDVGKFQSSYGPRRILSPQTEKQSRA